MCIKCLVSIDLQTVLKLTVLIDCKYWYSSLQQEEQIDSDTSYVQRRENFKQILYITT